VASTIIFHGINTQTALLWAISTMLVIQSISDIRTMMSSDILSLSIFACCVFLAKQLGYDIKHIVGYSISIIAFFVVISIIMSRVLHKQSLGFGDVKIFASLVMLFSFEQNVAFIGLCGFFGIISHVIHLRLKGGNVVKNAENNQKVIKFSRKSSPSFPFIPSITLAFLLVFWFKIISIR
jgi:prepilin signal peptidase PulO-like enzyme (type II secretory pathway)